MLQCELERCVSSCCVFVYCEALRWTNLFKWYVSLTLTRSCVNRCKDDRFLSGWGGCRPPLCRWREEVLINKQTCCSVDDSYLCWYPIQFQLNLSLLHLPISNHCRNRNLQYMLVYNTLPSSCYSSIYLCICRHCNNTFFEYFLG